MVDVVDVPSFFRILRMAAVFALGFYASLGLEVPGAWAGRAGRAALPGCTSGSSAWVHEMCHAICQCFRVSHIPVESRHGQRQRQRPRLQPCPAQPQLACWYRRLGRPSCRSDSPPQQRPVAMAGPVPQGLGLLLFPSAADPLFCHDERRPPDVAGHLASMSSHRCQAGRFFSCHGARGDTLIRTAYACP